MSADMLLRPLAVADAPMLARATLDNLNWSGQRFTERDLTSRSDFRRYTQLDVERGDFGLVAECAEETAAMAWALFLPATAPGYGHLDESTPEVSLWVREDFRGRGVGRSLLRQLKQEAVDRGVARLSLSVEVGNFARLLYESEGFAAVPDRSDHGVMVWGYGVG